MAANLTVGAVSVTSTQTSIRATDATRTSLVIQNLGPSDLYIGETGVTTANGFLVSVGDSMGDIQFTGQIFGITASGTADVRYWDEAT